MKRSPTVDACDPLVLEALENFGKAHAVVYLCADVPQQIYPLTTAGGFRNRPFFMMGDAPHWFPEHLQARVTPVAVEFYRGEILEYYVTPVHEAFEVSRSKFIEAIDEARSYLGADGIAKATEWLDPDGEMK